MTPTSIIGPGSQLVSRYTAILMKMKLRKLRTGKRKKDDYSLIDITFLIIFPIVFLVFNIIYWYFYILPSNKGRSHISPPENGYPSPSSFPIFCITPPPICHKSNHLAVPQTTLSRQQNNRSQYLPYFVQPPSLPDYWHGV